jgi:Ni,Fe-hydrogenase maturation factor
LEQDSLPLKLIDDLKQRFGDIEFIEFDPTEENLEKEGRNLNIIDTVEGIDRVVLLNDIEKIKTQKVYSMHDFDLGYNLKLLKKLGSIDSVRIFGVPMNIGKKEALGQLVELISANLPSGSGSRSSCTGRKRV